MKRIFIVVLAVLMTITIFAGCTGETEDTTETGDTTEAVDTTEAEDSTEPEEEGYLKLWWEHMNTTNTGFRSPAEMGNYIECALVWDTLVRFIPETGEMVYLLAEDITANDNYTMFTVKLKEDAIWHDGTPVTAADIVYTYNAAVFGYPATAGNLSSIKGYDAAINGEADSLEGVYATNDYTVIFELSETNQSYISASERCIFAYAMYAILPEHLLGDVEWEDFLTNDYWEKPIGTGPYMVDETSYPEYCTLVRFDDYHGETAGIKNILLTSYNDSQAAYAAALAGDLYLIRNMPIADGENIVEQNSDCEIVIHNAGFARTIFADVKDITTNNAFQNAEVRKAFNLIIDKQAIVDYLGTVASVATTYNNDSEYNSDIPLWERDVETGVEMLEAAGYDFSKTIRLIAYYTDQATVDIFDIIVANLAEAGIEAEYVIDGETCGEQWETGEFDFIYFGGGTNTSFYKDYGIGGGYDAWFAGFEADHRQVYTNLWGEYQNTIDANEKKRIAGELQLQYMEDLYGIPLYFLNTVYLVNSIHLQGYKGISTDYEMYAYLGVEDWSLAE